LKYSGVDQINLKKRDCVSAALTGKTAQIRLGRMTGTMRQNDDTTAFLLALGAVTIWAGWMSATRFAAIDGIAPIDVSMLRYGVPALMLAPVWPGTFRKLRTAPTWSLIAMLGWGLPFVWLVTASLERANVVHLATIVFCTMPVFAVLGEWLLFGTTVDRVRLPGFLLIAIAASMVIASALIGDNGTDLYSVSLMLIATAGWAAYTVAFKHSGFSPAEGPAYVCVVSTILLLAIKALGSDPFFPLTWPQIAFHAVAQGVLSGFVATILYTMAIARIGATRTASFSVLMPMMGTAIAFAWLGEAPSMLDLGALAIGTLGFAIVNGVIRFR